MVIIVLLGTMLLLSALSLPLVFSILAASLVTLVIFRPGLPLVVVPQLFVSGMDQSLLLAIVFFFFAGELMNRGGITERVVDFAHALVGHIKGGLAHVNIVSSIVFSGISGSAVADTAAIGTVMIPAMARKGFSREFSAAVTQTSSVIGPIIPPSIPMLVYASLAEVSVGKMFLGGIVPGLLIGCCLMAAVYVISDRRNYPCEESVTARRILQTGGNAGFALVSPLIIVGGILGGVFTATEAGAVAAVYSFLVGKFIYRELSWKDCWTSLLQAAAGTSTIMVILGASSIFAWIVADLQISHQVAELIFSVSETPWIVLLLVNVAVLIVGLFMDPLAALIILIPMLLPTVVELGISPLHFGVVIVMNLMIGLCTPPVGYLIYLSASIAKTKPEGVIQESLPFFFALLFALLLCIFIPEITMTLPGLTGK
ncbi:C4-dicarboxylate ABC transporter permease [candidate division KSB3 bacterium]|uniref:C4-dicarboxylate ABC transporter permease n=1 Tax=candidate division KSB3 bacterium TaxID=2044937 RepID=A0A2G6E180_9BACT|nr:MAG: C4-dicarboxylate ABC transporter permease [candidate division KSB3 bacterium]PIE28469.1 MAG: C4-dicarboxylate ABC transporter permease [candidate division KSB3 bacterium]